MGKPSTPTWASDSVTDTVLISGNTVTYQNKIEPPIEIQSAGILAKTPLTLGHLNYQFDEINKNLIYLKRKTVSVMEVAATTFSFNSIDLDGYYFRFNASSAITFTIAAGILEVDTKVKIRQAGSGVVTIVGSAPSVQINTKTGFQPKTSGAGTTITLIKVADYGFAEVWDVYGEVGT